MKQLKNDLKNKKFKNLYLFYGAEEYLKKAYENRFINSIVPQGTEMMNLDIFDAKSIKASEIIDASDTMPFMNDYRLVIIRESELFSIGRKDDTELMSDYVKSIPENTVLVFVENKVDKRNKLFKAVNTFGYCADFKTPSDKELIEWVQGIFNKNGKQISGSDAMLVLRNAGSNMETVENEINKLIDFKKAGNTITKKDIDEICTKSLESKIFDLVDAIGNKKADKALNIYNNLILLKESPIMILTMIARQFRIIIQCKHLLDKRLSIDDIAQAISQRSFVVREAVKQSKNFSSDTILNAVNDCLDCDVRIKTGKISDKLGVEILIIKYSTP